MKKITIPFLHFFLPTKHENVTELENVHKNCNVLELIKRKGGFYYYHAKYITLGTSSPGLELTIKTKEKIPLGEMIVNENFAATFLKETEAMEEDITFV